MPTPAPNVSWNHDDSEPSVGVGNQPKWTWTVPLGEAWNILFCLVRNRDSIAHRYIARLVPPSGGNFNFDELPALGAGNRGVLMAENPQALAGFNRRPGELWLPSGFAFEVAQQEVNASAVDMEVILAFAIADVVQGQNQSRAVVTIT